MSFYLSFLSSLFLSEKYLETVALGLGNMAKRWNKGDGVVDEWMDWLVMVFNPRVACRRESRPRVPGGG